jgi:mRNA-degrading endonuclease HigB of HigAB toxin-antitoxin module
MRIIGQSRLIECWERLPELKQPLQVWHHLASRINWGSLTEVCQTFGSVDFLRGGADSAVVSFRIGQSAYRLIAAIHFESHRLFFLKVTERGSVAEAVDVE